MWNRLREFIRDIRLGFAYEDRPVQPRSDADVRGKVLHLDQPHPGAGRRVADDIDQGKGDHDGGLRGPG